MAQTKQIKAAAVLNNAFTAGASAGGDGVALLSASHPTISGTQSNILSTAADLNETSLEQALIDIAGLQDERGLKIAVRGTKLIIPKELQFIAERKYPIIKRLLEDIERQKGCHFSRLTGSGSVCYGLFGDQIVAKKALNKLKSKYPKFWFSLAKTV